jgi:hypothetical protein
MLPQHQAQGASQHLSLLPLLLLLPERCQACQQMQLQWLLLCGMQS